MTDDSDTAVDTVVALAAGQSVDVAGWAAPIRGTYLYAGTIFVSAFLLFQVQLIISKYILPWFGGTAAVWTTAMLFFQVLLLAGYAYAHLISTRLSAAVQIRLHIVVLVVTVLLLGFASLHWRSPIMPTADWKPVNPDYPVWRIIRLLLASVGLPFLVLSTTSPLLQAWFSRLYSTASPYRLYALSNLGSLLGLVSYPFLVEPRMALHVQGWTWSVLFVLFAVCCCGCAWLAKNSPEITNLTFTTGQTGVDNSPSVMSRFLWTALPAAASCMLLAFTNKICQDVAVIPFLWVVPLVVYLLSFIVCFDRPNWYRREIFHPLFAAAMVLLGTVLLKGSSAEVALQVGAYLFALLAICMVCHGELVRLKPAKTYVTSFYLLVAAGGALGGLFVALVAPQIFNGWWELHIGVMAAVLLSGAVLVRDASSWLRQDQYWLPVVVLSINAALLLHPEWSKFLLGTVPGKVYCIALLVVAIPSLAGLLRREAACFGPVSMSQLCFALPTLLFGAVLITSIQTEMTDRVGGGRNFFGSLALMETTNHGALGLRHGAIIHGFQIKNDPARPTGYYAPQSGAGLLLANYPRRNYTDPELRVGVVGLGVGTLAAYSKPGDYYRFYEINPLVAEYAAGPKPEFTFLKNAAGRVDVVMGDARLSLEREAESGRLQKFDVLVLDAFSGDAVPVHLLTKEAMEVYLKHLRGADSVIAVHITNKTLDLRPVVVGLCREFHLAAMYVPVVDLFSSEWLLLSRQARALQIPELQHAAKPLASRQLLWTDNFSNLYQILRPEVYSLGTAAKPMNNR